MNAPVIRVEHRQHQTLTPRLQQAVRLLQLSSLDFAQELRDVMGKNPFLEHEEPSESEQDEAPETFETPLATDNLTATASTTETTEPVASTNEAENDTDWERDNWQNDGTTSRQTTRDNDFNVFDMVPADVNLRQHLRQQSNLRPLSDRDRALVGCVIESLDDDGYLRTDLAELARLVELDPAVEESEMSMALKMVQSFEPSGVGARSISECLRLQLHLIEQEDHRELAKEIVEHHLERLAHRDCTGLAKLLGRSLEEVEIVCERVRHMDPRPGWRFGSADIHYVTPDVIAKKIRGKWMAVLNPAVVPRVRLNQMYADLFKRHREGQHSELASHLQEARWTVRNVEQRFATILSVAEAILRRQHNFLEFGPLAMKPLGLREIAEEVGLHESTVSRVTNNKYMATPAGVFELKYFFSRAMPTQSGGTCSATAIRGLIKDMIDAEDGSRPLSDAEIARQLARQGLTVARRTVTKYRQLLKMPAVEQRRRHA
jgi:RNA polymerase sigma-54 factor